MGSAHLCGGPRQRSVGCSEIKLGLVRRLAATTIQSELLEAKVINGDEVATFPSCAR